MSHTDKLVCGLLNIAQDIQDKEMTEWARSLTVSWLRFKYSGEILESEDLNQILDAALQRGYQYCFIQCYGHIVLEHWSPGNQEGRSFQDRLSRQVNNSGAVTFTGTGKGSRLQYPACMLVNLDEYRRCGQPRYPSPFFSREDTVNKGNESTEWAMVDLGFSANAQKAILSRYRGQEIRNYGISGNGTEVDSAVNAFLCEIRSAAQNSSRGVFLLNFEPYSDIETPPPDFKPPLSVLYSVAAGLKPNRILETHGFHENTRVVIFDYSSSGLEFRRLLLEEWDGRNYPQFLKRLLTMLPSEKAYYWHWNNLANPDFVWSEMDRLWLEEVARWGGEKNISEHWKRYRNLKHEFVLCNLLADTNPLLPCFTGQPNSAIWWSNAFSTIYSNWHYTLEERKQIYRRWVEELAARSPGLYLYGADWCNISVNWITAGDYLKVWGDISNELTPRKACGREILF